MFLMLLFLYCRLKIFVPIAFLAWAVLVPVNWTSSGLEGAKLNNVTSSDIDKLSISNVQEKSQRFQKPHLTLCKLSASSRCYILDISNHLHVT